MPFKSLSHLAWTISQSQHIVVMTGAGLSVDSGIPAFRDRIRALWSEFDPREVASLSGYETDPEKVWTWHRKMKETIAAAKPNPGHAAIAGLAALLPSASCTVITQNIDGLHTAAGSHEVIELHGNVTRLRCHAQCGYVTAWDESTSNLRSCPECGAPVRPDVVWFEESLSDSDMQRAQKATSQCDVFIVAGTSAMVQPAASLPRLAKIKGALLVEINPEETRLSQEADIVLRGGSEAVLPLLIEQIRQRV